MFDFLKNLSRNQIGLDITPEGIVMVVLHEKKNKITLKNYINRPFQTKVFQNGQLQNFEALTEELKSTLDEYKIEIRNTVISMPSNSVFVKKISLPDIPEDELKVIAPQEASKHLPLSEREMNVDFQILNNNSRQTGNKIDVLLCALSKNAARSYLEAISNAGLYVQAIDISSFAMIKALSHAELINETEKTYISVLIDYSNTDINIIQNGMPVFCHNIDTGKKNIIENVINSLGIKKEEVLKILPKALLMLPGTDLSEDQELNRASNSVRSVYSNISTEIQKTIEFFNSDREEPVNIERIAIGGSGVCVQNIDKYFYNKLRIDTCLFDPFINMSEELQEKPASIYDAALFSTSIGLALKEVEN